MIQDFALTIGAVFILEIGNCLFPYYSENPITDKEWEYHQNIGFLCAWEKEDFIYNEETGKWDLAPDAGRNRNKGKKNRKRGGNGLR